MDNKTLGLLCSGDERAWTGFVSRYGPLVWSATKIYGFDHATREDIYQDVFTSMIKGIKNFDPNKSKIETYLAAVTRNKCYGKLKKVIKRQKTEHSVEPGKLQEIAKNISHGGGDSKEKKEEMFAAMEAAMRSELADVDRLAMKLHYYLGFSYGQISEIMQRDNNWVKNSLHRSRESLRKFLRNAE